MNPRPPKNATFPNNTFLLLQFPVELIFFSGIHPAGGGIYPSAGGKNLDFCLCTIPTVGLYGKYGEITATQ